MRIVFLESTTRDLQWFRHYYRSVFPEGSQKAARHFKAVIRTVCANPHAGHPSDVSPHAREFPIPRTPFVLVYRVGQERIEVLRLWDTRQGTEY